MKKIISIFLAVVMCMVISVPAFAVGDLTRGSDRIVLTGDQREVFFNATAKNSGDNGTGSQTTFGGPTGVAGVYITEIRGYPLLVEEETGELFYVPTIGTGGVLPNQSQAESLRLTTAQANGLYQEIINYASTNGTAGYHYSIVGWFIEAVIETTADYPMYIKYHAGEPNFGIGAEESTVNIPYTDASLKVGLPLPFPSNYSETEYYHIDGIEGTFTYRAAFNNQILSIPFSAGMAFNWKNG